MSTKKDNEPLSWFAARTRHGQEISVRDKLLKAGVEHFIPTVPSIRISGGRRRKCEKPLISNLVFIRAAKSRACELANSVIPVYYLIDRVTRTLLVVPDKQMDDFARAVRLDSGCIDGTLPELEKGSLVRVTGGALEGVEGQVLEISGRNYVVLSLCGLIQAKVEIPTQYLEKL